MTTSTRDMLVTVVAVAVVLATLPTVWTVAQVRADLATQERVDDLVDGTVATRQAPTDYDGDGVDDAGDRCPTRPEVANGYKDGDGCPDVVATTGAS